MSVLRLRVEFGDVVMDELLATFAGGGASENDPAFLFDGDGNTCLGSVVRLTGEGFCLVKPDWRFWIPAGAPAPSVTQHSAPPVRFTVVQTGVWKNLNDARGHLSAPAHRGGSVEATA